MSDIKSLLFGLTVANSSWEMNVSQQEKAAIKVVHHILDNMEPVWLVPLTGLIDTTPIWASNYTLREYGKRALMNHKMSNYSTLVVVPEHLRSEETLDVEAFKEIVRTGRGRSAKSGLVRVYERPAIASLIQLDGLISAIRSASLGTSGGLKSVLQWKDGCPNSVIEAWEELYDLVLEYQEVKNAASDSARTAEKVRVEIQRTLNASKKAKDLVGCYVIFGNSRGRWGGQVVSGRGNTMHVEVDPYSSVLEEVFRELAYDTRSATCSSGYHFDAWRMYLRLTRYCTPPEKVGDPWKPFHPMDSVKKFPIPELGDTNRVFAVMLAPEQANLWIKNRNSIVYRLKKQWEIFQKEDQARVEWVAKGGRAIYEKHKHRTESLKEWETTFNTSVSNLVKKRGPQPVGLPLNALLLALDEEQRSESDLWKKMLEEAKKYHLHSIDSIYPELTEQEQQILAEIPETGLTDGNLHGKLSSWILEQPAMLDARIRLAYAR